MAEAAPEAPKASRDRRTRLRAGSISLAAALAILALKLTAWVVTGSTAVLSDAVESVVNVVAALFMLVSLAIASRPADESHPYGHGKVEFLASGFEGGLIAFAGLVIVYQGVEALWSGRQVREIDFGLLVLAVAGVANALLGFFLLRTGRSTHSPAIEADGFHVLSDVWTTAGVLLGLGLVRLTGWHPLDPLVAIAVALNLGFVGLRIVRRAVGALLDESDPTLLARVAAAIASVRAPGVIAVHHLRAIRSGGAAHVDAHLVVPRFWTVSQAHEAAGRLEDDTARTIAHGAEFVFHLDPCRSAYCSTCLVEPCPVRAHAFVREREWSLEELTSDPPP